MELSPKSAREHDLDSYDCWCSPQLLILCDECDGDGCWKCGYDCIDGFVSGLVEIDRSQVDEEVQTIIVHNYPPIQV